MADRPQEGDVIGTTDQGRSIILFRQPNGSLRPSSTKVVTVPDPDNPGMWMNIPSIFNGKQVSEDEAIRIIQENGGVDPETRLPPVRGFDSPTAGSLAAVEEAERLSREDSGVLAANETLRPLFESGALGEGESDRSRFNRGATVAKSIERLSSGQTVVETDSGFLLVDATRPDGGSLNPFVSIEEGRVFGSFSTAAAAEDFAKTNPTEFVTPPAADPRRAAEARADTEFAASQIPAIQAMGLPSGATQGLIEGTEIGAGQTSAATRAERASRTFEGAVTFSPERLDELEALGLLPGGMRERLTQPRVAATPPAVPSTTGAPLAPTAAPAASSPFGGAVGLDAVPAAAPPPAPAGPSPASAAFSAAGRQLSQQSPVSGSPTPARITPGRAPGPAPQFGTILSDLRLKTDIAPVEDKEIVEALLEILGHG